ncbi:hypothetical protein ACG2OD_14445 [Streptomyces sp. PDY-4]|uniref:hypothetical protein n=1 Tax=Streptomyces sp. PDY-4 TaxID=3376070 RepID=UPI0037911E81
MAEATKKTRTVATEVVTLTLSVEEAETLMAVGAKIGGDRSNSPRKHYDSVVAALSKAGVRDFTAFGAHPYKHLSRSAPGLVFYNEPTKTGGLGLDPYSIQF